MFVDYYARVDLAEGGSDLIEGQYWARLTSPWSRDSDEDTDHCLSFSYKTRAVNITVINYLFQ